MFWLLFRSPHLQICLTACLQEKRAAQGKGAGLGASDPDANTLTPIMTWRTEERLWGRGGFAGSGGNFPPSLWSPSRERSQGESGEELCATHWLCQHQLTSHLRQGCHQCETHCVGGTIKAKRRELHASVLSPSERESHDSSLLGS